jgi:hypothetical protein
VKRIAAAGVTLTLAACGGARPVHLVAGMSDTVVVNNHDRVLLPVHGVDARGRAHAVTGLRYEWLSGDPIPLSADGYVTCTRQADVQARVSRGELSTRFVLLCRPIKGFRDAFFSNLYLVAGGRPTQWAVRGVGLDGKDVTRMVGSVTIEDERVAHVDGMEVYPKAPGRTTLEVDVGDCSASFDVIVAAPTDNTSAMRPNEGFETDVHLAGGQMRSWPLSHGPYHLWLRPDSGGSDNLILTGHALNCSRWPTWGQLDYCIALAGAQVVVGNPRSVHDTTQRFGRLYVFRPFDSWYDTGFVAKTRQIAHRDLRTDSRCGVMP